MELHSFNLILMLHGQNKDSLQAFCTSGHNTLGLAWLRFYGPLHDQVFRTVLISFSLHSAISHTLCYKMWQVSIAFLSTCSTPLSFCLCSRLLWSACAAFLDFSLFMKLFCTWITWSTHSSRAPLCPSSQNYLATPKLSVSTVSLHLYFYFCPWDVLLTS